MSYLTRRDYKVEGFTLIEILIVIGIIAILAGIVLVAINPARQFRQASNTQRESNVNAILNAIGQYTVDHKGDNSGIGLGTTTAAKVIGDGAGQLNICAQLVPIYIPALPSDPNSSKKGVGVSNCSAYEIGYTAEVDSNGRITVKAPLAINPDTGVVDPNMISDTR